ncbi:low molecular weight protein-tyrosine-phosphatase [Streptomyces lavendulae]|uniref:low molecular weight protein-tyrosine-phosphatase n=1 Tax=Streptomyces lavendulae TaxID=1914 RepID=UPI00367C684D
MAESVFRSHVADAGLGDLVEVDSAGTGGWHEGDGADPRTVAVLEAAGYEQDHRARQFRASWFDRVDLVIALDAGHLRDLRDLAPTPEAAAKVRLLRSYDPAAPAARDGAADSPDALDVPDPYYGSLDGFEECLELVEAASPGLLDAVRAAVKETTP